MSEIKNLKPESIWRNFYNLTQVPRPSGHLEQVKAFLLNFAKEVGAPYEPRRECSSELYGGGERLEGAAAQDAC